MKDLETFAEAFLKEVISNEELVKKAKDFVRKNKAIWSTTGSNTFLTGIDFSINFTAEHRKDIKNTEPWFSISIGGCDCERVSISLFESGSKRIVHFNKMECVKSDYIP